MLFRGRRDSVLLGELRIACGDLCWVMALLTHWLRDLSIARAITTSLTTPSSGCVGLRGVAWVANLLRAYACCYCVAQVAPCVLCEWMSVDACGWECTWCGYLCVCFGHHTQAQSAKLKAQGIQSPRISPLPLLFPFFSSPSIPSLILSPTSDTSCRFRCLNIHKCHRPWLKFKMWKHSAISTLTNWESSK